MLIGREMSSSKKFPGIYPMPSRRLETVPSPRTIPYLKELYDTKLDKQFEPNTVYVVDENGNQKNISIEELMGKGIQEWLKHDAPADGKQYTRQDHEWKEKISAIINDYSKTDNTEEEAVGLIIEDHTNEESSDK